MIGKIQSDTVEIQSGKIVPTKPNTVDCEPVAQQTHSIRLTKEAPDYIQFCVTRKLAYVVNLIHIDGEIECVQILGAKLYARVFQVNPTKVTDSPISRKNSLIFRKRIVDFAR